MVDCPQEAYEGPELPVDPIQVLCDKVETILDGIVMTQTVVLEPESKDLLAQCIAQAVGETTLTVTLDNVDAVAAAICTELEPKFQTIVDAVQALGGSINTNFNTALLAQTTAIVAAITTVCDKLQAITGVLNTINTRLASNQVGLLECLNEIKLLLDTEAPAAEPKIVESIKYCIDDPDNEGESLRVLRYLYDDGTVGEEMLLTTIAPDAKECC